jgi:hypothetical protein
MKPRVDKVCARCSALEGLEEVRFGAEQAWLCQVCRTRLAFADREPAPPAPLRADRPPEGRMTDWRIGFGVWAHGNSGTPIDHRRPRPRKLA